jgi:hypothetical protein
MWENIQKHTPRWFFDASGGILNKRIYPKPLIYSIVMHDRLNEKIQPFGEFVTTSHKQSNISENLLRVKNHIESNVTGAFKVAPIIVTDFSWALMNSVLFVFNKCTASEYIQFCFSMIFEKDKRAAIFSVLNVRLYLCCAHFLKLVIKRCKKIKVEKSVKTFFIYCFTLLQNSVNIDIFKQNLSNIAILFNSVNETKRVSNALEALEKEIRRRELYTELSDYYPLVEDNTKKLLLTTDPKMEDNLKENSPFKAYFDSFVTEILGKGPDECSSKTNKYHSKQLYEIISEFYYIMPLWTGIIINMWESIYANRENLTRLSNNPVENWFKILKNNILKHRSKPSQHTTKVFKHLVTDYFKLYNVQETGTPQSIQLKKDSTKEQEEKWSGKNETKKRKKSIYYTKLDFSQLNKKEKLYVKRAFLHDILEQELKNEEGIYTFFYKETEFKLNFIIKT